MTHLPDHVDAVLFDLFETLVMVDTSGLPVLRVGGRSMPSTIPAVLVELRKVLPTVADKDALRAMATVRAEPPAEREPNSEIAEHVFFAAVLRRLGVRDDDDVLAHQLADVQMSAIIGACRPLPGARALLAALRTRGLRTAVVSNLAHAASVGPILAVADRSHRFDAVVTSIDVGYCKPDEQPFRLALARLGVESKYAIHIGDDPDGDVGGARRTGIYPVWFNPSGRGWPGPGVRPTTVTAFAEVELLLWPPGSTAV